MPSASPRNDDAERLQAMETQAIAIQDVFRHGGFQFIDPPILQPADVFLNLSGEDIRRRMYVFTDPGGDEVCLRPDLTIPTCRLYLAQDAKVKRSAKYCYDGRAFRYQPGDPTRPREFRQAGAEWIGTRKREEADAKIIALAIEACSRAGLNDFQIKIGDVGLFFDLINALPMAEQWRWRLKRYIWQPAAFHDLLDRLVKNDGTRHRGPGTGLLNALSKLDEEEARAALGDVLDLAQIAPVGGRSIEEIADRLLAQASEARADALPRDTAKLINDYLAISGSPKRIVARMRNLAKTAQLKIGGGLDRFERRLDLMADLGVPLNRMTFDAEFGRNMEYYTGFVFELTVPTLGSNAQIAGGGRYDTLLHDLGAPKQVPAVGCMIRTERLAFAVKGGA